MKRIAILGSTGSIGVNALDCVKSLGSGYAIAALAALSNAGMLSRQAREHRPGIVCIGDAELAGTMRRTLPRGTRVVCGNEGLCEIVGRRDVDMVLFAITGSACLMPLLEAIDHGKEIALANKEALVVGGDIVMRRAKERGVTVVPIDSEHSAIFQCLGGRRDELSRIILTGSGGPLRTVPLSRFDRLPRSAILDHPKWRMGRKISVDSATMMNKGLEVIEACRLFGVPESRVDVVIHPEAIIHSMVELVDRSVLGQLGVPDMRLAIQYAMTYPRREASRVRRLDLFSHDRLTFARPDTKRFPCLELAREAIRRGGTAPAVLNAADEEAVAAYLDGRIVFSRIAKVIHNVLSRHVCRRTAAPSLKAILDAEAWGREETRRLCSH